MSEEPGLDANPPAIGAWVIVMDRFTDMRYAAQVVAVGGWHPMRGYWLSLIVPTISSQLGPDAINGMNAVTWSGLHACHVTDADRSPWRWRRL